MKKIICNEPRKLKMEEAVVPFRKGEALIRIKRIGICGTDLHACE